MTSNADDWERDMIREMTKVFEQMGLPIDMKMLERMMAQLEEHFERMGIDSRSISNADFSFKERAIPKRSERT